jgi:branched-chain amino acid transport system ATP-binding protein
MMLELRKVAAGYDGRAVIENIDVTVGAGEIIALVGANGAGKSTLVKTVSGLLRPMAGEIFFEGKRIDALSPAARVRLGIVHVPEGRQVFAGMTVAENLRLGGHARRRSEAETLAKINEVCQRFPVLLERMHDVVANFSGGQQQMLAVARGLMANPRLLILDEPSLGLSPVLVAEIFRLITALREQGLSILLSEQNARSSLLIADRGYVLENGNVVLSGKAKELLESEDVAARYLGVGAAATDQTRQMDDAKLAQLRVLIHG